MNICEILIIFQDHIPYKILYDCEKYIGGVALGLKNYFKSRIGRILHTNFPKPIKGEVKILRKYL